jgi:hypothetical protein
VTVVSYLRLTTPAIAVPHRSWRVTTLPAKAVEAPRRVAVAARVVMAYSPQKAAAVA